MFIKSFQTLTLVLANFHAFSLSKMPLKNASVQLNSEH